MRINFLIAGFITAIIMSPLSYGSGESEAPEAASSGRVTSFLAERPVVDWENEESWEALNSKGDQHEFFTYLAKLSGELQTEAAGLSNLQKKIFILSLKSTIDDYKASLLNVIALHGTPQGKNMRESAFVYDSIISNKLGMLAPDRLSSLSVFEEAGADEMSFMVRTLDLFFNPFSDENCWGRTLASTCVSHLTEQFAPLAEEARTTAIKVLLSDLAQYQAVYKEPKTLQNGRVALLEKEGLSSADGKRAHMLDYFRMLLQGLR